MAYAIVAAAVVAALASAYATYSTSQAQQQASRYNAKLANNQAINAQNAAKVEMDNRRELYKRQMAAQRAAIGGSGVDPSEGSPLLVQLDSAEQAALDLARVRYEGEVRSTSYQSEVNLQRFAARSARRSANAGYVAAGASVLSAAYGQYRKGSTASPADGPV